VIVPPNTVLNANQFASYPAVSGPIRKIVSGDEHTCALMNDGRLVCWGDPLSGAVGHKYTKLSPYSVLMPQGYKISSNLNVAPPNVVRIPGDVTETPLVFFDVAAAGRMTCGILDTQSVPTRTVYCFGWYPSFDSNGTIVGWNSFNGEIQQNATVKLGDFNSISISDVMGCVNRYDAYVYCWDFSRTRTKRFAGSGTTPYFIPVVGTNSVKRIAVANHFVCITNANDQILCAGQAEIIKTFNTPLTSKYLLPQLQWVFIPPGSTLPSGTQLTITPIPYTSVAINSDPNNPLDTIVQDSRIIGACGVAGQTPFNKFNAVTNTSTTSGYAIGHGYLEDGSKTYLSYMRDLLIW
jgi:hypothetical protein